MPNKFKHNPTGKESDSLFIGQWAINNSAQHTGGGPSSNTALFTGADIPDGGWALYHEGSVFVTISEDDLIGRANELGASALSISDALEWASTHEEVVILNKDYESRYYKYYTCSRTHNSRGCDYCVMEPGVKAFTNTFC